MQEPRGICYAVVKDRMGMVEYLSKKDMHYVLHKLDAIKFHFHRGETSYS